MAKSFYCNFNTMFKPVSLCCGHLGSKSCMDKRLKSAPQPTCPECKVAVADPKALTPSVNFALHNITRDLTVQCVSRGCVWSGVYLEAEKHYNQCPKLPIKCQKKTANTMQTHYEICEAQDLWKTTATSLCLHAEIPCPVECGTTLPW